MKRLSLLLVLLTTPCFADALAGNIFQKFDHDLHNTKALQPRGMACSTCHRVSMEDNGRRVALLDPDASSTFSKPPAEICHQCHRSTEAINKNATQDCEACHSGPEGREAMKPQSHRRAFWRNSHALEARAGAKSCNECHETSTCAKCHLSRNDIELTNHGRNFKFFHSVEARTRPQSCESCHSRNFCSSCHMGK